MRKEKFLLSCFALFCLWNSASGLLSPKGVNFEGKLNLFSNLDPIEFVCKGKFFLKQKMISFFFFLILFSSVKALMGIKNFLVDPHGVFGNWDDDSVDPCDWNMITCSPDGLVIGL